MTERILTFVLVALAILGLLVGVPLAVAAVWPALVLAAGLWLSYWLIVNKQRP